MDNIPDDLRTWVPRLAAPVAAAVFVLLWTIAEAGRGEIVENVVLFDAEPEGIVTVRFSNATAAKACVKKMDGRAYERRYLEAKIANGTERFQKRGRAQ